MLIKNLYCTWVIEGFFSRSDNNHNTMAMVQKIDWMWTK